MIDYIILEDERFAYEEIKRMMNVLRPDYNLKEWADSVERAVSVLTDGTPDLLIADIRLSDGLCFDVFERKQTHVPVIFTTAYDEFALQAFRVNSVDYLLKPIKENDLERAFAKFEANCLARPTSEQYKGLEASYLKNVKKTFRWATRICMWKRPTSLSFMSKTGMYSCIRFLANGILWIIRWSNWKRCSTAVIFSACHGAASPISKRSGK